MNTRHFMIFCLAATVAVLSGCGQNGASKNNSTVTVSGVGTVSVEPDMVRLNVSLSNTSPTTRQAQEAIGKMASRVLYILENAGIADKDIKTESLMFSPEYEWRRNKSVLIGQRAEQGIEFAVRDIRQDSGKVARIIDSLAGIDGITMNRISFGVSDNTEYFVRSRELAFGKAMQKAQQYAGLSGLKIVRVLDLSEDGSNGAFPIYGNRMVNQFAKEEAVVADAVSTVLPSGQMEITTRISVTFLLE